MFLLASKREKPNLYLNSKVAKDLGIEIPKDLLDRATENITEVVIPSEK